MVAGTAADADRVAYVKTVRPTDGDEQPLSEPQSDSRPRYTNEVHSQCHRCTYLFLNWPISWTRGFWSAIPEVRHSGGPLGLTLTLTPRMADPPNGGAGTGLVC